MSEKETWEIRLDGSGASFRRFIDGQIVESYIATSKHQAMVYAACIIQGYEPPRGLRSLDKTAAEIRLALNPEPAALCEENQMVTARRVDITGPDGEPIGYVLVCFEDKEVSVHMKEGYGTGNPRSPQLRDVWASEEVEHV